jgi:uncharacterized protein involved in exopolysaccharide biosynthesis
MPDIVSVIGRRWKLMLILTLAATGVAFIACLMTPRQYLGVTTALPVNSLVGDKARVFNANIEALYAEIGTADELDKIEGTSKLDTIYLAAASNFRLYAHYKMDTTASNAREKAALRLRKNTTISRTGYGELKVKVWDKDNVMAANLANALMQTLNDIHQQLQTENTRTILQRLKEAHAAKQQTLYGTGSVSQQDSIAEINAGATPPDKAALASQSQQYSQLISEYELALKSTPKTLLVVEHARPSPWADKPKTAQIVLFAFLASLLFSFLLALFVESRSEKA